MKRDCHEAIELLAQRLRGSLSDADGSRLQAHLDRCEACRAAATDQEFAERVALEAPALPRLDTATVLSAIKADMASAEAARRRRRAGGLAIAVSAAALGALIVVAASVARHEAPSPSPRPGHESIVAGATGEASVARTRADHALTALVAPEQAPTVAQQPQHPSQRNRRPVRWRPSSPPAAVTPERPPENSEDRELPESPQDEPDLSEFFALGPPPPEPTSPELLVETEEVIAPDGSVMSVAAVTDVERGELLGYLSSPHEVARDWQPLPRPKGDDAGPSAPADGQTPGDPSQTRRPLSGGGLG